eukprot:gene16831-22315_t
MDDDIIRIMISTDNHLGYSERDSTRCDDSFASFEEMLWTAKDKQVDFVLLAGDLFHENKPSRRALHTSMELFRKYTLGENPVYIEILNDQNEIFKNNHGIVNYQDPYLSVSLPIFSIHGNHDDPSREGGQNEALSALDLLSINNNVNYFGKAEQLDSIEIIPILIKKNNTYLALYGLGAIRDERLNRMWNKKNIKFVRPSVEQGRDNFFNIFVLHQNRDYGRGRKNCVHESMIPEWMDLVIWGNEHECKPNLAESLVGTFRIYQPGSSIATSYSEMESSLCPKHMEPKQILIRLRVDPAGLPTINLQRFGSQFVGKVGNPGELLLFSRRKKENHTLKLNPINAVDIDEIENDEPIDTIGAIHKIKVEELVMQALGSNNRNLNIIPETELGLALEDYVKRKHANAFTDTVNESLEQTQSEILKSSVQPVRDLIIECSRQTKEKLDESVRKNSNSSQRSKSNIVYSDNEDNDDDVADSRPKSVTSKAKRATKKADDYDGPPKKGRKPAESKTTKATAQSKAKANEETKSRGSSRATTKKKTYVEEDSDNDDVGDDIEDDDYDVDDMVVTKSKKRSRNYDDSDDDIEIVDSKPKKRPNISIDDDDFDDAIEIKPKAKSSKPSTKSKPAVNKLSNNTSKFATDDDVYIDELDLSNTVPSNNQSKAFDISKLNSQLTLTSNKTENTTSNSNRRKMPLSFSQSESLSSMKKPLSSKNVTSWD